MAGGEREVYITDHAVVRYLERVMGFDLEPIRDKIRKACASALHVDVPHITVGGFVYSIAHHPGDKFPSVTTIQPVAYKPSVRAGMKMRKDVTGRPSRKSRFKERFCDDDE